MEYKGYNIVSDGTFGNLHIKKIGHGPSPKAFEGSFTSYRDVMERIDAFLVVKEKRNAKNES